MKFSNIYIKNLDQFQDVELDFTDPNTGKPVEKVCFIGRNGTGKSKILKLISWFFHSALDNLKHPSDFLPEPSLHGKSRIIFKILHEGEYLLILYFDGNVEVIREQGLGPELIKQLLNVRHEEVWNKIKELTSIEGMRHLDFIDRLVFNDNSEDLFIYSPDESGKNGYFNIQDVPVTNLSDALALFQRFSWFAEVSPSTIDSFWKLLVYSLKKRDDEREKFERQSDNLNKTKAQLIAEFDTLNPKILNELSYLWNRILGKAGLEFDSEGASNPIQLTDNLKAYIRLKRSKRLVPYSDLSTGIRNYIFRIGHIRSLYFNRIIKRGVLLVDEPENGLFPDFLFELMDIYQKIILDKEEINNTQIFFSTHNPIIAGQFKPHERIILDWNDDGSVNAKKGFSPEGDDPNDVLTNDFELKNLMGPEGRKMWDKYQKLIKQLNRETDIAKKDELISSINQIGQLYNFDIIQS